MGGGSYKHQSQVGENKGVLISISTNGTVVWHRSAVLITRAEGARKFLGPFNRGRAQFSKIPV